MRAWFGMLRRLTGPGDTGGCGEHLARRHLRARGYRILGHNLRNRFGEVDILAEAPDRRTIVVVEVKTSAGAARPDAGPPPEVHVNLAKQRKLVALACQLARARQLTQRPIRFDVIAVHLGRRRSDAVVRHHPGAFESHV
jgi:putative endonuclease